MSELEGGRNDDTTHVVGLLDRAGAHTPPLHVGHDEVVARGRRLRSRRRQTAAGVGALALAGTLWLGIETLPLGGGAPAPASVTWSDGSIDIELFDNGPNPEHEPDRTHWTGRLRTVEGGQHPELVLTRNGGESETIVGEDGPGESEVFRADGITVLVWPVPVDGIAQEVLWTDGVVYGQGGEIEVPGGSIRYATSEHVEGAEADVVELYLVDEQEVRAASGAPVESTLLQTDDMSWVVGLDPEEQILVGTDVARDDGWAYLLPVVGGAAHEGGVGDVPSYLVGMLPEGASDVVVSPAGARSDVATLAGQQVLLATSEEGAPLPTVRFVLDGDERELSHYVQSARLELVLADLTLGYGPMPDGLELQAGGSTLMLETADLTDRAATVAPHRDGAVVVVPGWAPSDSTRPAQVALEGRGDGLRWVEVDADAAQVRELFDGRPVTLLALDSLEDGEEVVGIGEAAADGTVTELDLDKIQVRSFDD
ncbi:hypothetical protein [Serinicoccus kebangsaanensis]|uniref:hypothetical protein n=1 Tax=Serinicoccus kebangsaanensis TaxID=2602069 RepID=UPI00178C1924|nr:hypothetical protein [Serinicoccus kebangsaanensis]